MSAKYLAEKYKAGLSTPLGEVSDLVLKYDDIINLSLGDPDFITNQDVIERAFNDAKNGYTRYADPLGEVELREEISNYYQTKYSLEVKLSEIMAVVGACHGMFLVLEAILDPEDEVIIHEPYFTPYNLQVKLAGGIPVILPTYEKDNFQIDINKLESMITDKTKAIIINSPCNPTGACFSEKTLESIAKLAIAKDILILSDDVYSNFTFDRSTKLIATWPGMKERTVSIGSFSKDYAMTGWRIGYVVAPSYIIKCIKNINEGVCYSAPTISQRAALEAIKSRDKIQPEMLAEFKKRVFYSYKRINRIPNLQVMEPQGTFYLFVNIKKTGLSSVEISKKLLEEAHLLVIPGIAFGESGEGYIRIACTVGIDKLGRAFDRMEKMEIFQKGGQI